MPKRRVWRQIRRFGVDPWLLVRLNGVSVTAMRWRLEEVGGSVIDVVRWVRG